MEHGDMEYAYGVCPPYIDVYCNNIGKCRGKSQVVQVNETDYRVLSDNSVDYARVYGFIWIWLMSLA